MRINPFELHACDPEFYEEVYVGGSRRKTDLWGWTVSFYLSFFMFLVVYGVWGFQLGMFALRAVLSIRH